MEEATELEYTSIISQCKVLFKNKTKDYGTAWRILRLPSITDQVFIKAQRIRSIQEKNTQKIAEGIPSEFIGIINYCIIGLIQMQLNVSDTPDEISMTTLEPLYDKETQETLALLKDKNHDYQEAWRSMRVSSITDIILMKLMRVKKIENNKGKTLVSEGIDASYRDIINYAVFSLILLKENTP